MTDTKKFEGLLLAICSPILFFGVLEILVRVCSVEELISSRDSEAVEFEMPTWLMSESNSSMKAARLLANPNDVAWIKLFQAGDGFRAHLKPGAESSVVNTFSKVKSDRNKTHHIKANSIGFRGDEPQTDPGARQLLVFGDSSSFGWGVEKSEVYHQVYGDANGYNVLNFAIPGDSSEYGKLLFDSFIDRYPAQVAILSFGANDAKPVYYAHRPQIANFTTPRRFSELYALLNKSALYRVLDTLLMKKAPETSKPRPKRRVTAVPSHQYAENIGHMIDGAHAAGISKVLMLSLCNPPQYAAVAEQVATEKGALFFNAQQHLLASIPALKEKQIYPKMVEQIEAAAAREIRQSDIFYISWDGCHPNVLGHRLIADELQKLLVPEK